MWDRSWIILHTVFEYYNISYDITSHTIIVILYCSILYAIFVYMEDDIIWIWNIRGHQLLRYFMYSISYGIVIESFTTIT